MRRFIGSPDETIECKIEAEREREGTRRLSLAWQPRRRKRQRRRGCRRWLIAGQSLFDSIPFAIINSHGHFTCRCGAEVGSNLFRFLAFYCFLRDTKLIRRTRRLVIKSFRIQSDWNYATFRFLNSSATSPAAKVSCRRVPIYFYLKVFTHAKQQLALLNRTLRAAFVSVCLLKQFLLMAL
jgi:hypothetical protein